MRKLFLILTLFLLGPTTYAQNYQLHSVYMYSFIRYVQWPADDDAGDFVIGVLGDSPVIPHLEKMAASKKANDRTIVVKKYDKVDQLTGSEIIFVPKEASDQLGAILDKVGSHGILLVTEQEGLGLEGSNINFVIRGGKLAFELNKSAMERANLKVSTELSRLAIVI